MSKFSPSDAALEGFRLVRERPGTILAWSGIYFLGILMIALVMVFTLREDVVKFVKAGGMESGDFARLTVALEHSWPAFLLVMLLVVGLYSVISGGVYRLVLRPEEPGFLHLRLGADEVRLVIVNTLMIGLGAVFLFVPSVLAFSMPAGSGFGAVILGLGVAFMMTWIGTHLLLAAPMTFAVQKISILESWRLTKRCFWPLLGMILLAIIFYVIIWLLLSIISAAFIALAGGQQAIMNPDKLTGFAFVPFIFTMMVQLLMPVLQIVTIAGPIAFAYRGLAAYEHAHEAPAASPH